MSQSQGVVARFILPSMQPEVRVVTTLEEMNDALTVRRLVFIEEMDVPESIEIDAYDADPATSPPVVHVVAYLEGRCVATARLLLDPHEGEYPHVGRVAVLREGRGKGFGRTVMLALHDIARGRGIPGITLAAQVHAIGFYETLGYVVRGDVFLDANIEHRWMDLTL
jgi:predicted GNAT family N-acyltransferase